MSIRLFSRVPSIIFALIVVMAVAVNAHAGTLNSQNIDGKIHIANSQNERVRIIGVNWFGAESGAFVVGGLDKQPLAKIIALIKSGGFNTIRLPWCNEMLDPSAKVKPEYLLANPNLSGLTPLQIYDAVIKEATQAGLMVIIDNHRSRGDWCCDEAHGDGLWYTTDFDETRFFADWQFMAKRYADNKMVIGAELRNEIRPDPTLGLKPTWGDGNIKTDWKLAAEKVARIVHDANPDILIIVGGIGYQSDLSNIAAAPILDHFGNKLVYAAHDYVWDRSAEELNSPTAFAQASETRFGYLNTANASYSAPILITEWGTCVQTDSHNTPCSSDRVAYRNALLDYVQSSQIDFVWWPLNGTQMAGYNRHEGQIETYGLLNPSWSDYADPDFVRRLTHSPAP